MNHTTLPLTSVSLNHTGSVFVGGKHTVYITDKIISDRHSELFQLVVGVIMCCVISIVGIATNIVNIIVFIKQGAHKENGIVNLLGLAVSDLCCVITMFYLSISYAFAYVDIPNLPWDPFDVMFITASWPHMLFAQITRAVTAYVAFERCICVVFPFKVKSIITPKRSIFVIVCIFLSFMVSYSPAFIKQRLAFRTDPETNVTKLVLVFSADWKKVVDIMWYINSVVFNIGSVVVVLVCTLITVSRLRLSKTWRDSVAVTSTSSQTTGEKPKQILSSKMRKEKKLITMITFISAIFLICYIPDLTFLLMYTINPDIRSFGKYNNLALLMYGVMFLMETVNSSINIIVYYKMSSRYKQVLRQWIGLNEETK